MITVETATDIAMSYREIERGEKLLADLKATIDRHSSVDIRDVFGRQRDGLQLGVPSGPSSHTLFQVPYRLAISVIEAHIAHCKAELTALNMKAEDEIGTMVITPREQARFALVDAAADAAALFREYETHHRAKASEEGRPEKAARNATMAKALEDLVATARGQFSVAEADA